MRIVPLIAVLVFNLAGLSPSARSQEISPIQAGVHYLFRAQLTPLHDSVVQGQDWAGNWPQFMYLDVFPQLRFRDVNPFMAACMFPSLALMTEENAGAVGLTGLDLSLARHMRARALELMQRFQAPSPRWDAGTYGFWPLISADNQVEYCAALAWQAWLLLGFDFLWGDRAPVNICFLIPPGRVPADADDTAKILEARLLAAEIDGTLPLPAGLEQHFERWRDLGQDPMRVRHDWMNHPSGAFVTWLAAGAWLPRRGTPQDVDLVVNANVLTFLGRYGRLDAAGVDEAIALINRGTQERRHHRIEDVSQYYPDTLLYHYVVSRAYADGGVLDLAPAVEILADELEEEAIALPDGTVFWARGHPWLNTAFAVITLLNAGRDGPLVDGGAAYLRRAQDPVLGNWPPAPFFLGTTTRGAVAVWEGSAASTAVALEALMRAELR
jgi:hypothetical protein